MCQNLKVMFTELVYCGVAVLKILLTEAINDLKIYRTINILSLENKDELNPIPHGVFWITHTFNRI